METTGLRWRKWAHYRPRPALSYDDTRETDKNSINRPGTQPIRHLKEHEKDSKARPFIASCGFFSFIRPATFSQRSAAAAAASDVIHWSGASSRLASQLDVQATAVNQHFGTFWLLTCRDPQQQEKNTAPFQSAPGEHLRETGAHVGRTVAYLFFWLFMKEI